MVRRNGPLCKAMFEMSCTQCLMAVSKPSVARRPTGDSRGLRDYGLPPLVWGGDVECEHEWGNESSKTVGNAPSEKTTLTGGMAIRASQVQSSQGQFCRLCGCWRGSLGLEPTPELYIEHLVGIFREVERVLRDDGTMWCNIAGAYYGGKPHKAGETNPGKEYYTKDIGAFGTTDKSVPHVFLKPKDWIPIPWMLGMALQADGWWLRSPIIWAKPNPMPESVRDRPTTSHEYILLLSKKARYYFDQEAVRERPVTDQWPGIGPQHGTVRNRGEQYEPMAVNPGRNIRDVWTIATHPFPEAHFATFPPRIPELCIKAGTSERGCCPECGKGWQRVVEKTPAPHDGHTTSSYPEGSTAHRLALLRQGTRGNGREYHQSIRPLGWRPQCECDAGEPIPCVVLDPFVGSGTTVMVALRLGRRAIGVDLSEEYTKMSERRIVDDSPLFNRPRA